MAMSKAERIAKRIKTLLKQYQGDTNVYTDKEWKASPKHEYGEYALVHFIYEGPINHIINGYMGMDRADRFHQKLNKILDQYNCSYEIATHWAIYIYEN